MFCLAGCKQIDALAAIELEILEAHLEQKAPPDRLWELSSKLQLARIWLTACCPKMQTPEGGRVFKDVAISLLAEAAAVKGPWQQRITKSIAALSSAP